jgi:hypothetical protein
MPCQSPQGMKKGQVVNHLVTLSPFHLVIFRAVRHALRSPRGMKMGAGTPCSRVGFGYFQGSFSCTPGAPQTLKMVRGFSG